MSPSTQAPNNEGVHILDKPTQPTPHGVKHLHLLPILPSLAKASQKNPFKDTLRSPYLHQQNKHLATLLHHVRPEYVCQGKGHCILNLQALKCSDSPVDEPRCVAVVAVGKANEGELDPSVIGSCLLGNTDNVRESGIEEVEVRPGKVGVDLQTNQVTFERLL